MESATIETAPLLSVSPIVAAKPRPKKKSPTMRNHWFDFVAKTRKRLQRGNKEKVSHREAMRQASAAWVIEKEKVKRRIARAAKKAKKSKK